MSGPVIKLDDFTVSDDIKEEIKDTMKALYIIGNQEINLLYLQFLINLTKRTVDTLEDLHANKISELAAKGSEEE